MEKLGINVVGLIAQILNVGILLFVFLKFLYKPILGVLEKRQQSIETNIRLQEQLETRLNALEEKERALMKHAKLEANRVMEEARTSAKKMTDSLLDTAKAEAIAVKNQAQENLKKELRAQKEKLETMMATKAAEIANVAIGKLLDEKTRARLTEKQVREFIKTSRSS